MSGAAFTRLETRVVPLPLDDIDTDQIIPARFLKATIRTGFGEALFADWRFEPDGAPRADFPLNRPGAEGAEALLVGSNFGCGSSREHAPWALLGWGFQAVIGSSFADIFRANALKNGLLPVEVDAATHAALLETISENPQAEVVVDLASRSLSLPDGSAVEFPIDEFARRCLMEGVDELGYLLSMSDRIAAFEAGR